MWSLLYLIAFCCSTLAANIPYTFRQSRDDSTPRKPTREEVQQDLGSQLSYDAKIYFPGSSDFDEAGTRWSVYSQGTISIVVEAATPDDISATVRYANHIDTPFITINGGHGAPHSLSTVQDGIQIWMRQFRQLDIAEDGQTARLGGGLKVQDIIDGLDAVGKASSTGGCACVGLGAGLGGGSGRLQGLHGMIADNILEANVILWNGTQITVNNESYSDLFWGLRGAGHNFGVVTDVKYQIYDRPAPLWTNAQMHFNNSKLEDIFELVRSQADGLDPKMTSRHPQVRWAPDSDPDHPIVEVVFAYAGSRAEAAPYLDTYLALEPINPIIVEVPYTQIPTVGGTGLDSDLCRPGLHRMQFSIQLKTLETSAGRAIYNLFEERTKAFPATQKSSVVLFQAYSLDGMQKHPDDFNAYPHRSDNYIIWADVAYEPGAIDDEVALAWGEETRRIAQESQGPDYRFGTYVNYAVGYESLESVYGYEPWRLERLRELKKKYDPEHKFSHFMPIV